MLGRASPFQLFGIAILEVIFYSANNAINDNVFRAADVGGSMLIHSFGAYFGLACSVMLQRKKAIDHSRNSSAYHSDMFAMIGKIYWDLLKYTGIYDSALSFTELCCSMSYVVVVEYCHCVILHSLSIYFRYFVFVVILAQFQWSPGFW